MKLVEKSISLNQPGTLKIIPEEQDDLWLLYNLIAPGDIITADTSRKIHHTSVSGAGKKPARVRINLEIKITAVDYDKDSSILRIRGRSITANEHIAAGAFHTLELEKNKQFDLTKGKWDSDAIDALRDGCNRAGGADLAVILMKEGSAYVYLIGKSATTLCAKVEASSSPAAANHKKGANKFFENVLNAFVKHIDFSIVRCVVIGSQGSVKDEFRRYLIAESQRLKLKSIQENKSRIVVVSANPEKGNSLKEVLLDSEVINLIKDTQAAIEIRALKEFSETLLFDPDRACYGSRNVEAANEMKAIETLLINDDVFRSAEIATRKKYIELVKSVKKAGGKAFVFSPTHVSAEELGQLTGIAAILRFPLPHLDDMEI